MRENPSKDSRTMDSFSLERVIAEYVQACESGQEVDVEALRRQHPHLEPELSEFLAGHQQFVEAAESVRNQLNQVSDSTLSAPTGRELTPPADSSLATNPPKILGDYEILEEIDRGGMGVVFKARHIHLGRIVALKLIRSGELASDEEVQRFRSEAEAAAALSHPGIVPIYEVGMIDGLVFYTMAYINGRSLVDVAADESLDTTEAMRIVYKLCGAIGYAHERGVYHRDLKPANVLLERNGQPIVIDFGLAKIAHRDNGLTNTGQLLGTPAYMAPEHASGRAALGPGADVYALGAILYFLCAGQPPFTGPTPFDVLLQVLDREAPNPSKLNRSVSKELDYVCQKALEKDPQLRYQSPRELSLDLQSLLQGNPIDIPGETLVESFVTWWRREPILLAHVCGIGATTMIVASAHIIRGEPSTQFPFRMGLLVAWFLTAFPLQRWVRWARWRDTACLSWATVDVIIYTTLVGFADSPSSMLLIGYPMLIVASSLFYRQRFVLYMTMLCIVGFLILARFASLGEISKPDYVAIFVCGLAIICLSLLATIRERKKPPREGAAFHSLTQKSMVYSGASMCS